jgi:hypothetical protein
MTISHKGLCPCEDFEFSLRYKSPSEEAVPLFCPFCGVGIEQDEPDTEDEEDSIYDDE